MGIMYQHTRGKNPSRKRTAFILRTLVFVLLLLALADLGISLENEETATIFLVDVSDSASSQQKKAEELIKEAVQSLPEKEKIGVITFGKDTKVEQFVTDKKLFERITAFPSTSATNMEKAVQAALSIYPENTAKRLVLVTDSMENEGKLTNMSSTILSNDIQVSYLKLEQLDQAELYVSNVTIPDNINIGDVFNVTVKVESNIKTSATLTLYEGKTKKLSKQIEVQNGSNTFLFQDQQAEGGLKNYRVTIEPIEDTITVNNEFVAFTNAVAPAKFLLIEGIGGESSEYVKLLKACNVDYDVVTPELAPGNMVKLCGYKAVILMNVNADKLSEGFMNIIESYVKDYGGGLITVGGRHSYAPGNYKDTILETILPVTMDIETPLQNPSKSVVLVIDHSGSMSDLSGGKDNLELAKEAAISTLDLLESSDQIGVVAFDDTYTWVVPLQKAADKDAIKSKIAGISIGGGTSIYPAVNVAADTLIEDTSEIRHIILLTDGQDGYTQYEPLYTKLDSNYITLSTVGVGASVDVNIMQELAYRGSGRYYESNSGTDIPKIFIEEMYLASRSYLVNREFVPSIAGNSAMIGDAAIDGMPKLYGYVATTKKPLATNHLVSDTGEPILTTWQYGIGKAVAFTSDGQNQWTKEYANWDKYAEIWKNIFDYVVTEVESDQEIVEVSQGADGATIKYETKEYTNETKVNVVYTDENGNTKELTLDATAPGKYQGEVPLEETGIYGLSIQKEENGQVVSTKTKAVAKQYSKEYRFASEDSTFDQFIKEVGAKEITDAATIFKEQAVQADTNRSIVKWLIFLAMCFFFLDIVVRWLGLSSREIIGQIRKWKVFEIKEKKPSKEAVSKEQTKERFHISFGKNGTASDEGKKVLKDAKIQNVNEGRNETKKAAASDKKNIPETKTDEQRLNTSQLLKKQKERNK